MLTTPHRNSKSQNQIQLGRHKFRTTAAYDSYWRFACERQKIFFNRIRGEQQPWTKDRVLREFKFTNAYRASDRVSQYLIRNVIYRQDLPDHPIETVFRVLLFKIFNRIETWELLEQTLGPITYEDYSFKRYDKVLTDAQRKKQSIYSGAYIMPSAKQFGHSKKHRNHLHLINSMLKQRLPEQLADAPSMEEAFMLLRSFPTLGDFLAYQYVTDLNYSVVTDFTEMEFVVPGPGAISGIRKCFSDTGGLSDSDVIRCIAEFQDQEFARLGMVFQDLWGRKLQLIDCQNLFCEVDKYSRVVHPDISSPAGRTRIKQRHRPTLRKIDYWYPPKWSINAAVSNERF